MKLISEILFFRKFEIFKSRKFKLTEKTKIWNKTSRIFYKKKTFFGTGTRKYQDPLEIFLFFSSFYLAINKDSINVIIFFIKLATTGSYRCLNGCSLTLYLIDHSSPFLTIFSKIKTPLMILEDS